MMPVSKTNFQMWLRISGGRARSTGDLDSVLVSVTRLEDDHVFKA